MDQAVYFLPQKGDKVTMKKMLLLLLALIVVPAWAGEATVASSPQEPSAQASQNAPKHKTKKSAKHNEKKTAPAAVSQGVPPPGCTTGCSLMACPPPTGSVKCCNTTTHQAC